MPVQKLRIDLLEKVHVGPTHMHLPHAKASNRRLRAITRSAALLELPVAEVRNQPFRCLPAKNRADGASGGCRVVQTRQGAVEKAVPAEQRRVVGIAAGPASADRVEHLGLVGGIDSTVV